MLKVFLFLILFMPVFAEAQQSFSGRVYDLSDKKTPLPNVLVKNLSADKSAVTRSGGDFIIAAKVGDLLEFSFSGYHTDTLFLISLSPRAVYLPAHSTNLNEVSIVAAKINPSILSPDPQAKPFKRFENDALKGKSNNDRVGGLKFNLGYGKYKKQQEKQQAYEERDFYEAEINETFTPEYVSNLTKLKAEDLKNFMRLYRPSALLVAGERPFNYAFYTVKAYHTWLKLPAGQQKLTPVPNLK